MGTWEPSCGRAGASPGGACPGAATPGRARSAAAGSGLSCGSVPPPEIKPKGRIAAGRSNANDRRQRRHREWPSGIRGESSVRSLHSCGLVVCTTAVYQTNQAGNTEVPCVIQYFFLVSYK